MIISEPDYIRVYIYKKGGAGGTAEVISDVKKKDEFLLRIRNSFTHKGASLASPIKGFHNSEWFRNSLKNSYSLDLYEIKGKYEYKYHTLNWPDEIRDILRIFIKEKSK